MSARVSNVRPAGPDHQVVTVVGGPGGYRREPCAACPWRRDLPTGVFPAEAFRHSATTAYDMAGNMFACHMSGGDKPATCAGFLLRGADHNLAVRFARSRGEMLDVSSTAPLYDSYREMAEANGVDPDDPALRRCR